MNEAGKAELVRPAVPRDKLHELISSLPPCVVGMAVISEMSADMAKFPSVKTVQTGSGQTRLTPGGAPQGKSTR